MAARKPKYNGVTASWSNFSIKIRGEDVSFDPDDFVGLDWSSKLEPGKVRARGPAPVGRTEGEYSAEGKLSLLKGAARTFLRMLRDAHPDGKAGLVEFDILGQWTPYSGDPDDLLEVELRGCRVGEHSGSQTPSSDAAVTELPLDVMRVFEDGVCLIGEE